MKELKIHFLNTIWSDAIILENDGHYAFVDTGSSFYYPMIEKHLNDHEISNIDFIILTHFHNDHYGNVAKIISNYKVGKLYLKRYYGLDGTTSSGYSSNEEYILNEFKKYDEILKACDENHTEVVFIDELGSEELDLDFAGITLELYDIKNRLYELYSNPDSEFYMQKRFNENFNSIGIFIKHNGFNIFLGADLTCSKTDIKEVKDLSYKMLEHIYNKHQINHIDIYKSCHHGGTGTNPEKLCDLLKCKYAVITNTARWLDTYDTFKFLKAANPDVEIHVTDYQKYLFKVGNEICYDKISDTSLFILLNKD